MRDQEIHLAKLRIEELEKQKIQQMEGSTQFMKEIKPDASEINM